MDVTIQWFGLVLTLTSLVGLVAVAVVAGFALVRVRRDETSAGLLLAGAAVLEGLTIFAGLAGLVVSSALRGADTDAGMLVLDVISVARPLAHGVVMVLAAAACIRLTRSRA